MKDLAQLPADQSWVRYQWVLNPDRNGPTGHLTISSVGKEMINGQPFRWIESKLSSDVENKKHSLIIKSLIPEENFELSPNPMSNAKQTSFQVDDSPPVENLRPDNAPEWMHRINPAYVLFSIDGAVSGFR